MPGPYTTEDKERAERLHRDGLTYGRIAKEIGCSSATVKRWASDGGWMTSQSPDAANARTVSAAAKRAGAEAKAAEMAVKQIATDGVLLNNVSAVLAKTVGLLDPVKVARDPAMFKALVTAYGVIHDKTVVAAGGVTDRTEVVTPEEAAEKWGSDNFKRALRLVRTNPAA